MSIRPQRGEVWVVDLDATLGREQAKKRPCIVISVNAFNASQADLIIVVPLTSKRRQERHYISVSPPEGGLSMESYVLCEQIRSVSLSRFSDGPLGKVKDGTIIEIIKIMMTLLGM